MNKKKVLLSVLALILVCALSVAGTLALLAENVGPITNTFVASATPDNFFDTFALKEYAVAADNNGGYTQGQDFDADNTIEYKVVPGVVLPKHALVELKRTNETPAYLYIEVVAKSMDDYTYSIANTWKKLDAAVGPNGGEVYVLSANNAATILGKVETAQQYDILTDNEVTVKADANLNSTDSSLKFYAYLSQATVAVTEGSVTSNTSDAAKVFNACFPTTTPTPNP